MPLERDRKRRIRRDTRTRKKRAISERTNPRIRITKLTWSYAQ